MSLIIVNTTVTIISNISSSDDDEWTFWSFGTITFTAYVALNLIAMIIISIITYNQDLEKVSFIKSIWNQKDIYLAFLAHIYDTTTDIAVLVEFGKLAFDDYNYQVVNMYVIFFSSLAIILFHRIMLAMITSKCNFWNIILVILDLYIFKILFQSLHYKYKQASSSQKILQMVESLFEALPQV